MRGFPLRTQALRSAFLERDLDRWVVLGVAIGLGAGLGAVALYASLQWTTHVLLGSIGSYHPPTPIGEGHAVAVGTTRSWRLPAVVGLGGLGCGIVVSRLAKEAGGDGTNAAIDAVHHDPAGVRSRVSLVKLVASAITIGAGGSGGPEGPTTQISAGFASLLARRLRLSPADARIAVTAAIGAGIGAIFRAPLGGALFGAEVSYREDAEVDALIPSFVAAIVAFAIFGAFESYDPIFGTLRDYRFVHHPVQFLYFGAIGIACGSAGRLYAWSLEAVRKLARKVSIGRVLAPGIGGLATGAVGIALPGAIGTGYGWVQTTMSPHLLQLSPWVLTLPLAKILTTSLSIGSGGSGGIFGPGMVIGGFTGAAVWWLLHGVAPGLSSPDALRHRRDDRLPGIDRPHAPRGPAHGRRDDGQPDRATAGDACRRHRFHDRRPGHDLHEPARHTRRVDGDGDSPRCFRLK